MRGRLWGRLHCGKVAEVLWWEGGGFVYVVGKVVGLFVGRVLGFLGRGGGVL